MSSKMSQWYNHSLFQYVRKWAHMDEQHNRRVISMIFYNNRQLYDKNRGRIEKEKNFWYAQQNNKCMFIEVISLLSHFQFHRNKKKHKSMTYINFKGGCCSTSRTPSGSATDFSCFLHLDRVVLHLSVILKDCLY